ncbi:30S ribosomal protein S1 [Fodinisporobacter ferrooxydans]|uniref:30S ribosomal protein S1 n=1 Tax=Fodinisporobacter ferrooxydans TaxID=2901836 RepID=A0ABY4CPG6_9BACL|nr:30S ribosomal protein S1 [Alicyclobacillaceae bacterium MYW30-H2]
MDEMTNLHEVHTIQPGDVVKGRITKIEDGQAFVDVGYKYEGVLPIAEVSSLRIEKVSDVLQAGDEVEVKVKSVNDEAGTLIVSKRAVDAEQAWGRLEKLYQAGEIFDVVIVDVVKGGLVADIGVRGFIPASLVERHFVEDFSSYKGQTLAVKIAEFDPEQKKVVLSHKAVVEEQEEREKQHVITSLQAGQILTGTVQRLTDFGVFVNIGGVDGLVHISELSHQHVKHPSEVVKEGDAVQVKVLKVDPAAGRISLSIRAAQKGPWESVNASFQPGAIIDGTVKRLANFGAFVEVAPGIEGLVHISQISNRHIANPAEVLEVGQSVKVKVLDVNAQEKRISLSIREAESAKNDKEVEKYVEKQSTSGTGVTLGDLFGDLFKQNK